MDSQSTSPLASPLASLATEELMTRDFETRPALVYERLRARYGPVAPVRLFGLPVWLVLGYREVLHVLHDESRWKKDPRYWLGLQRGEVPADWPMLPAYQVGHVLLFDDERRKAVRAAIDDALRPFQDPAEPQAGELRTAVERYADELIDVFTDGAATGHVDLGSQFARPLPLMVLNRVFGFPVERSDDVFMDVWRMVDSGPDAAEAIARLLKATTELAAHKKEHPGDDLTTRLVRSDAGLTVEEVGLELYAMLVYSDLPGHSITNAVLEVLGGSDLAWESLKTGNYAELVNRVHIASPQWANASLRFPVADASLGGVTVAAGDPVMPSIAAAHGDPVFAAALNETAVTSTRAHLAWGAGPHQCAGGDLSEMIATTAVSRLFDRCELELVLPVDQIPWRQSSYLRGVKALPARFRHLRPGPPPAPVPAAGAAADEAGPAGDGASPQAPAARPRRSRLWRFLASLRGGQD